VAPGSMAVDPASLVQEGFILLAFLTTAAFFSFSETAMIGVDRRQVKQKAAAGDRRAQLVDKMLNEPERVLSTVLIGNNLVNIGATAYTATVAVRLFGTTGAVVATIALAILIILATELLPKTMAVQNPLPIALFMARPLRLAEYALLPLVWGATWLSKLLARLVGVRAKGKAPFITQDEIQMLVNEGVESGDLAKFEAKVIQELFDFTETDVHRIMTPRDKVHWLPKEAMLLAAADMAAKEGRTRILVVDGDFDHVLGCVHVRDLLRFTDLQLDRTPVTVALRAVLFAPADLPADRLLVRMQKEHKLLAIIQEADGRNVGICTVEDLMEELVGEIHDEFDAARARHAKTAGPESAALPATSGRDQPLQQG
jgi:putative hemolysin